MRIAVELIADDVDGRYTARLPDIPAYGEGETADEAIADLREAIRGYVETFGLEDAMSRLSMPKFGTLNGTWLNSRVAKPRPTGQEMVRFLGMTPTEIRAVMAPLASRAGAESNNDSAARSRHSQLLTCHRRLRMPIGLIRGSMLATTKESHLQDRCSEIIWFHLKGHGKRSGEGDAPTTGPRFPFGGCVGLQSLLDYISGRGDRCS